MTGTPPTDKRTAMEAARWADRLRDSDQPVADRERLVDWLEKDPRRQRELEETQALLNSPELLRALAAAELRDRRDRRRAPVWTWAVGGIAACAGCLALLVALPRTAVPVAEPGAAAPERLTIASMPGRAREHVFPDGSVVTLNGGAELHVGPWKDDRRVELSRGDLHAQVSPDAARPFIVEASGVSVTALGTAFTVSVFTGATEIQVLEHSVRIETRDGLQSVDAVEGDSLRWTPSDGLVRQSARAEDWRTGWIETDGIRFSDLAELVERTSGRRIGMAPDVGALLLSGRFRISDADALARRAAASHGLSVTQASDGTLVLSRPPE